MNRTDLTGPQIRDARKRQQLTQRQLAARLATTQSVVSEIETGARRPSVEMLERIAGALGRRLTITFTDPQSQDAAESAA